MIEKCKKCGEVVEDDFCGHCGTPKEVKRINGSYLLKEIAAVLMMEKGLFLTIRELAVRPGSSIKTYLTQDRTKLMKPVFFIIITSLVFVLFDQLLKFDSSLRTIPNEDGNNIIGLFNLIFKNYGYANILMALFIAAFLQLFFRKSTFNYYESLVVLLYLIGFSMLVLLTFGIISVIFKTKLSGLASFFQLAYIILSAGQFYGGKFWGYFKVFWAYIFGLATFLITAILVGGLINLITGGF